MRERNVEKYKCPITPISEETFTDVSESCEIQYLSNNNTMSSDGSNIVSIKDIQYLDADIPTGPYSIFVFGKNPMYLGFHNFCLTFSFRDLRF